jgi:signal transduction histidine kinase
MPPGSRPARSYLAAPVRSHTGELLGGLFFGHPDPGLFHERDERLIAGLAAHAAIAVDNAQLYREARAARALAEAANGLKDEFLATLSHELRTPLTAIVGWAELLHRGKLSPAEATRAVDTIIRNATAQNQIIDDLLDVSRIITGKLQLDLRPVDIAVVVNAAIGTVTPAASAGPEPAMFNARRRMRTSSGLVPFAWSVRPRSGTSVDPPLTCPPAGFPAEVAIASPPWPTTLITPGRNRRSLLLTLRLMTRSYLVGFCTGSSAGFSPFKMRST